MVRHRHHRRNQHVAGGRHRNVLPWWVEKVVTLLPLAMHCMVAAADVSSIEGIIGLFLALGLRSELVAAAGLIDDQI